VEFGWAHSIFKADFEQTAVLRAGYEFLKSVNYFDAGTVPFAEACGPCTHRRKKMA
jgi:hypothetical protein